MVSSVLQLKGFRQPCWHGCIDCMAMSQVLSIGLNDGFAPLLDSFAETALLRQLLLQDGLHVLLRAAQSFLQIYTKVGLQHKGTVIGVIPRSSSKVFSRNESSQTAITSS